ncbi:MAG: hypothetical protein GF393_09185 [Armatimonadia bacterium]|nr:hypothetical protein [Armatimonadia bacterium]
MRVRMTKLRTTLMLFALAATAISAWAQVPMLVEDIRWGSMSVEQPPEVDLSQRKTLAVPELPSAPTIDAELGDPAWEAAARTDEWMVNTGERPAPVQTTAWCGTHEGMFYVGFRAEEPNTEGIVATVTETDGPAWNDDCFEMFVDGDLDLETARQLIINPLGTVSTLERHGDWNPQVTAEARVRDDAWMAEFAMPMSSLGVTGTDFGLNFCRERKATGDNELSCWSPTGGSFHQPGKFGLASLPGGWLNAFGVGKGVLGHNELSATIANPAGEQQSLRVRLRWWQDDAYPLERVRGPFTLAAGDSREVTVGYDVRQTGAPVQLELAVLDEAGESVAQRQVSQEIVDVLAMDASRRLLPQGERRLTIHAGLQLAESFLSRTSIILAVFDEEMILEAREVIDPADRVMRAELVLPLLETGPHSLHVVVKSGDGDDATRVAEQKVVLEVLTPVK